MFEVGDGIGSDRVRALHKGEMTNAKHGGDRSRTYLVRSKRPVRRLVLKLNLIYRQAAKTKSPEAE